MPIYSQATALRMPIDVDGVIFHKSDWMEHGHDPYFSPNVFLVEQPPNVKLRTHCHRQNQFQLFIDGDAQFGRHAIGALTVHYAGAYTGYGPLISGPRGLTYLTLRPIFDTDKLNMPEDVADMIRGPKRQLSSATVPAADVDTLANCTEVSSLEMIGRQPDHVAACLYTLPAGGQHCGLDPSGSGGQFYVVIAGAMMCEDRMLRRPASVFVRADEPPFEMHAAEGGLQVVCLQLALTQEAYRYHSNGP
jgi:hypothetical protein